MVGYHLGYFRLGKVVCRYLKKWHLYTKNLHMLSVYNLASVGTNQKQQLLIIVDIDYSPVQHSNGNARSKSVMSTFSMTFEIKIVTIDLC